LIDDMIETMRDEQGVGLAAPQVHRSVRLFVMDPGERGEGGKGRGLRVVVNPVLAFPNDEALQLWEGCLSIPRLRGLTERRAAVDVKYLDRHGAAHTAAFRGFPAAVVQHETDHLDGIVFLQRMPDLTRLAFEDEWMRFETQ
jgi:peptide deformylase